MSDSEFNYRKAIDEIEGTIATLRPPKRLLLVDDDAVDIDLCLRVLRNFHVETTVCRSGVEARSVALNQKFDLILFDLVMPGLDGLEFILGTAGLQPGARFLLVTGYPASPQVDAVLRLGAVMLAKPLKESSLDMLLPRKPSSST